MLWRHMWEWRYSYTFLDLGGRWRWVVSCTPRSLYARGKSPRYPLDRGLGGPQNRSGRWHCRELTANSPSLYRQICRDSVYIVRAVDLVLVQKFKGNSDAKWVDNIPEEKRQERRFCSFDGNNVLKLSVVIHQELLLVLFFPPFGATAAIWALAYPMKLPVSLRFTKS
jgi:hypothetical protein